MEFWQKQVKPPTSDPTGVIRVSRYLRAPEGLIVFAFPCRDVCYNAIIESDD